MTESIQSTTARIIRQLYGNSEPNKAVLAGLRGASRFTDVQARSAWPIILDGLDDQYLSRDGIPTYGEQAIFTATHLYAVHQQGHDQSVYGSADPKRDDNGLPVFKALSMLRTRADSKTAIDRRVRQALALTNYEAVVNALGSLIGIVKATKLPLKLDYAQLAEDLYWFQMSYEQASRVRLRWGQDYYGTVSANERTEQND